MISKFAGVTVRGLASLMLLATSMLSSVTSAQPAPPENACVQNGGRKLCVPGLVKGNWKYLYQYGSCQIGQGLVGAYYNLDQPYGDENTATLEGVAYNAQQNLCNNPSVIDYGAWATPQAPLAACASPSPSFFALTEDSNVKKTTISCSPNPNVSFQVYRYRPVQCPDGYFLGQSSLCEPIVPPKCDDCKSRTNFGNPINLSNGNKRQVETDYTSPISPLKFLRTYSSLQDNASGRLGRKWTHNYEKRLLLTPGNANVVFAYRGDGSILTHWKESGVWKSDGDINDRVTPIVGAGNVITGWLITVAGGDSVETYDATGTLLSINDRSGASITFSYSTASTPVAIAPVPGLLIGAVDHFGRALSWKYDVNSYLRRMDLPSGEYIIYDPTFDGVGNLQYVSHSSGGFRHYLYNETPYTPTNAPKNLLTGIVFEDGSRSIYTYDSAGKPLSTESASPAGAGKYLTTPNTGSNTGAATDPLGTARSYTFTTVQGISLLQQVTQPCPGCQTPTVSSTYGYDANGNTTSIIDFNGNLTCYAFDAGGRNLEIRRTQGLGGSNCASPTYKTESRRIETDWHTALRIPIAIREYKHNNATSATTLLRTTTYVYDGNNAAANPKGNVTSKSVKDEVNNVTRTWTYSNYDTYGRVGTIDGPRTDVTDITTYTYYANDVAQGNKRGMLWKVSNAANHVTEITDYDAEGRPLSMTDANGLVTTMAYWPRGWLKQRNVGGELTQYAYDNYGQLLKITMPDSSVINYGYDGAHRLWKISDGVDINSGNRIEYTLDNMGNRTYEYALDPASALARKSKKEMDVLGRLWKTYMGADASTGFEGYATTNTYDGNGNLATTTDPLSRTITNGYDALNRMAAVSVPALGGGAAHVTSYDYDSQDNLIKVTEPATPHPSGSGTWRRDTTYDYNGFNEVKTQTSKDTGITNFTYDSAGNLKTKADARGICATYTYDGLNRVTAIGYAGTCNSGSPTESVSYVYDTCTNGKGRLCSVTDKTGVTSYSYDIKGRVTGKDQTVESLTQSVGYQYNAAGQLETMILPYYSAKIGYTYVNNRIRSVTYTPGGSTTATVIAGCVDHEPFGPVSDWRWGSTDCNSTNPHIRLFDLDGRVNQIASASGLNARKFTYDSAARISAIESLTGLNGSVVPAKSFTYGYADPFNRLTSQTPGMSNTAQTLGYGYDGIGNRRTLSTSAPPPGLINDSLVITYGADNRPTQWSSNFSGLTTLKINSLGQRVKKDSATTGITRFVYDESGKLLGEYDNNGVPIFEHIWLGDLPIGVVRNGGIHYVHTDNLGAPRQITTTIGYTVWTWDNVNPFGNNAANELPNGGNIPFQYNLRFPGQYADKETGTSYNYFRDYDPATGRYVQSDPIGLRGGINTYGYVGGDPLVFIDTKGLFTLGRFADKSVINSIVCDRTTPRIDLKDPLNAQYKCSEIIRCFGVHEQVHLDDALRSNPTICASNRWNVRYISASTPEEKVWAEKRAYDAEVTCLSAPVCRGEPCDTEIAQRLRDIQRIRLKNGY